MKILKKKVKIWQTSVKTKLYVLWPSKQKLIGVNWSETFLKRNFLLIKDIQWCHDDRDIMILLLHLESS